VYKKIKSKLNVQSKSIFKRKRCLPILSNHMITTWLPYCSLIRVLVDNSPRGLYFGTEEARVL